VRAVSVAPYTPGRFTLLRYVVRRLLLLIPVSLGLVLLVFTISHVLPGDPVRLAAGPHASASEVEALRVELGYDRRLPEQFLGYISQLVQGDWGESILTRRPVLDDLKTYLPATLELVFAALVLAVVLGIPTGLLAAVYVDRWPDYLTRVVALVSISIPRFFLGLLLQLSFALMLGWLPLTGRFPFIEIPPPTVTGFLTIDSILAGNMHALGVSLAHLALPALAACLSPLAAIARMMRASTLEVLSTDYVLMERASGLGRAKILLKYVFKNAATATLTVIGLYFGWLLGGTVLVETVFDWPGIGLYATKAILTQDFKPIMGVTLVIGLLFITANLVVDLLYGVLDPRVTTR
jgi:peptide/nickel transport system permease protein